MKFSTDMRYPHPVLSESTSDFAVGRFECSFEQNSTKTGELRLSSNIDVTRPSLRSLIAEQRAALGFYIVCRPTFFNVLQEVHFGHGEQYFALSDLFGMVQIRPVIWTLVAIDSFIDEDFDADFGRSIAVAKGAILALGAEFRFSVERQKFRPFETIFDLAKSTATAEGIVEVDPDGERITLRARDKTFQEISNMRNTKDGRILLLNGVYLPAVMEVITQLQASRQSFATRKWYRVFMAKCDEAGIDLASENTSPFKAAQTLLNRPLLKLVGLAARA